MSQCIYPNPFLANSSLVAYRASGTRTEQFSPETLKFGVEDREHAERRT
jgi:hypothetical protein